jgi:hypothetical protein
MAKCMHKVVLQNTKVTMQDYVFFAWSADEVIIIDNQEWINVHAYMMQNWICILILLTLLSWGVCHNQKIIVVILQSIMKFGGLVEEQLASH